MTPKPAVWPDSLSSRNLSRRRLDKLLEIEWREFVFSVFVVIVLSLLRLLNFRDASLA